MISGNILMLYQQFFTAGSTFFEMKKKAIAIEELFSEFSSYNYFNAE